MSAPGMGLGRERQERQAWPAGPYRVVGKSGSQTAAWIQILPLPLTNRVSLLILFLFKILVFCSS